jgi:Trp operon repressor
MLRPVADDVSSAHKRELLSLLVTKDERRHVENYLQFLRYLASVEALCQRAEAEGKSEPSS